MACRPFNVLRISRGGVLHLPLLIAAFLGPSRGSRGEIIYSNLLQCAGRGIENIFWSFWKHLNLDAIQSALLRALHKLIRIFLLACSYPEHIHDLVRACLVLDPGKRPSALQLRDRAMAALASIQWNVPSIHNLIVLHLRSIYLIRIIAAISITS